MKITSILPLFLFLCFANAQELNGRFFVRPLVNGGEGYVGRRLAEDRSLNPKAVLYLDNNPPEALELQRLPSGNFRFRARGAPLTVHSNLLVALLIQQETADEWMIEPQLDNGINIFTIRLARDPTQGWIAPESQNDDKQIRVDRLTFGEAQGPFSPPTELFRFVPLYE